MKRTLISLGVFFFVAFSIWITIIVFTPMLYVEKAFVIIVYPSIAASIGTALVLWLRDRRT